MKIKKTARKLGNAFAKFDGFGHSIELNIGGESKIQSKVGAALSVVLTIVMLAYSSTRAQQLVFRKDSDIARVEIINGLNTNDTFKYHEVNFTIAFGVAGYFDGTPRDDPEYVQWEVNYENKIKNETWSEPVSIHKCTQEDYDEFAPIV